MSAVHSALIARCTQNQDLFKRERWLAVESLERERVPTVTGQLAALSVVVCPVNYDVAGHVGAHHSHPSRNYFGTCVFNFKTLQNNYQHYQNCCDHYNIFLNRNAILKLRGTFVYRGLACSSAPPAPSSLDSLIKLSVLSPLHYR